MGSVDSDRPWREEKRSWIFYKDKIEEKIEQEDGKKAKRNPNIICDEVDGNMFLLDCDTARLSIWSREWQTFTDVGVSALIGQVDRNGAWDSREIFKETKIYYKGIELQNKCIGVDAGILEFIDIKGELDRKYININRNGFTEQGEQFFEEQLYPGLLEAIHKVLQYLEKTEHLDRFCEIVEKACKEDIDRHQLIHLVVSVTVLAYYAMREEWNLSEKLKGAERHKENGWAELLGKLNEILSRNEVLLADLRKKTRFFYIDTCTMEESPKGQRNGTKQQQDFNFLQIFLPENHWAIVQERKDDYGSWIDYLVLIEGGKEHFRSQEYQKIVSVPHLEEDDERLEIWGKRLCTVRSSYLSRGDSGQQLILNWLLKNVPTVGLFANEEGNIRVNVLANKVFPSIYMNENFKFLLLRRMMDQAEEKGSQRFSTIVWQRREQLACRKLPFSIYFIKRGYLSGYTYHKAVVPFDGELWKKWKKVLDKKEGKNGKMEALFCILDAMNIEGVLGRREYCEDSLKYYLQKKSSGELMNIASKVLDDVLRGILSQELKMDFSVEEILRRSSEIIRQWSQIYYNAVSQYIGNQSKALGSETIGLDGSGSDAKELPGFPELCTMWVYCYQKPDEILATVCEVNRIYEEYISADEYKKREKIMIDYLTDRLYFEAKKEVVQESVESYKEELLKVMQRMERLELQRKVDGLKKKYSMYLYGLGDVYNERRYQ